MSNIHEQSVGSENRSKKLISQSSNVNSHAAASSINEEIEDEDVSFMRMSTDRDQGNLRNNRPTGNSKGNEEKTQYEFSKN